ncbi:TetR/AcrR family transcriptional regulator [Streptacidiphilus sp. P02-A3a]|uniref:TetR/AcrR family transcriptional regulator n=1 Tax=Streptacidiphilus sp. P02-A3a TaxID=2704468 RepID=UPI0015F931B4|nr:TetR family transcriptional regulator [Streptacidiphilus sp. P02-A3a]QMU71527.1 TetR family transcriptional regulator [Streptacidiphilus sp. P02-A3a]
MARPKNQEARRGALIHAAGRAIADRGMTGLRIKDIAAEAGVSAGSVLYYYPELDDLVLAVHQDAVERYLTLRQQSTDEPEGPVARMRAALASGLPQGPDDPVHRLLFQLHGLADHSAAHAALMASLFAREVSLYSTLLQVGAAVGVFAPAAAPPAELARNLVAMEDGYGLHIVARNPAVDRATALALLTAHARSVTGCPEL